MAIFLFKLVTFVTPLKLCVAVSFNHFGLSTEVVRGTQAMGFVEPTPIQLRAFPTCSCRTRFDRHRADRHRQDRGVCPAYSNVAGEARRSFRCLVLEPTRELAAQVETAFRDYGRFTDLRVRSRAWRRRLRQTT